MLPLEDSDSIVFWNEYDIASLMPEHRGRWRAVHFDGKVAHHPGPLPPGPWIPLGGGLVLPQLLQTGPLGPHDGADFLFPQEELAPVPEREPLPDIEGIACPRHQVYALMKHKQLGCLWKTDQGDVVWNRPRAPKACLLMPEMVFLKKGLYVNRNRIWRVRHDYFTYFVVLDNGQTFKVSKQTDLAERLGLTSVMHLEPYCPAFYGNYTLRDWPFELASASPEQLRKLFDSPRQLIGHLIYQRLRYRQLGIQREWADSYRGFWYDWVKHTLFHAGFLSGDQLEIPMPEFGDQIRTRKVSEPEKMYHLMFQVFDFFVQDNGLFTFEEFGFVEPRPEFRRIGTTRPEIILLTEKTAYQARALQLHEEFGVSLRMLASQPPLVATEFFAKALQPHLNGPVRIIAYVDYDVGGWIIARAFAKQLEFYGIEVSRVDFLIRGETFTPEEKRLHAKPLALATATHRTKAQLWFAETNGVDGQMLGIQADHVQPYQRLRDLFAALL